MILEDDALLADDLPAVLAAATQIKDFDLLQLETRNRAKYLEKKIFDVGPVQARALLIDRTGAAGYVLWPTGAKKLLDHVARAPGLADSIIAKPGLLRAAQVVPAQVIQNDMAQIYDVPQEWPSEISSVSSPLHRKSRKSSAQKLTTDHGAIIFRVSSIRAWRKDDGSFWQKDTHSNHHHQEVFLR